MFKLKFKKWFLFTLMLAVVALLIPSCTEDDEVEEEEGYYVTVTVTGGGSGAGAKVVGYDDSYRPSTIAYEGDLVELDPGTPNAGKVFSHWTTTPASVAATIGANNRFTMPAYDVAVTAVFIDDTYEVTVTVTGGAGAGAKVIGFDDSYLTKTFASVGDVVELTPGTPGAGKTFSHWTTTPSSLAASIGADNRFTMIASNVTVTAVFADYGVNQIRFTWEASAQDSILAISASFDDVKYYKENVWGESGFDFESATDTPWFDGSPKITATIYSSTIGSNVWKGKYFDIDVGVYTAVCEAEDSFGYFDIIANYAIINNSADSTQDLWYEIGFDVVGISSGLGSGAWHAEGWFFDIYNNPNEPPYLTKSRKDKGITIHKSNKRVFEKNGGKMELQYLVIRRPKN